MKVFYQNSLNHLTLKLWGDNMHKPEKIMYLVYYRNGNTLVPVGIFSTEDLAKKFIEQTPMIQFQNTYYEKLALDDLDCHNTIIE